MLPWLAIPPNSVCLKGEKRGGEIHYMACLGRDGKQFELKAQQV